LPPKPKRSDKEILAGWNKPGSEGLRNFLADVKPRILHADNRYRALELRPWQWAILEGALAVDPTGKMLFGLLLFILPRRHGKSTLFALIILWLVSSRSNMTVACLGNHEQHGQRVQMRPLRRIIRATPALLKLFGGETSLGKHEIRCKATGGLIVQVTPTTQSAYGDRFNAIWVSDWHVCPGLESFNAYQASLLDSELRLTLIDSNIDGQGGHVHQLEEQAQADSGIFVHRVEYRDFDHYRAEAPEWIDRQEAARLKVTTLPAAFDRDILGKRSSARNSLFDPKDIAACVDSYLAPVAKAAAPDMFEGRKVVVGGGLDRALSFSVHGDATIWTSIAKTTGDDGEPEYWIINQKTIAFSSGRAIKKAIIEDHEAYGLHNLVFEQYQSADLHAWAQDAKIPCELVHATAKDQASVFVELARIVQEHRLHLPKNAEALIKELEVFTYELGPRHPRFGTSGKFHDDRVYSLAWAIWSLRDEELAAYELQNIVCDSKSSHAESCYLREGRLILPCSEACEAHRRVVGMHLQHNRRRVDDELSLPEFFTGKVKVTGVRAWPGA